MDGWNKRWSFVIPCEIIQYNISELLSLAKSELPYFQRSTISENMKEKIKNIFREITTQELEEVQVNFPWKLQD